MNDNERGRHEKEKVLALVGEMAVWKKTQNESFPSCSRAVGILDPSALHHRMWWPWKMFLTPSRVLTDTVLATTAEMYE